VLKYLSAQHHNESQSLHQNVNLETKVEISWEEDDLYALLSRRVRESGDFLVALGIGRDADTQNIFDAIFPNQVDVGKKRRKPRSDVKRTPLTTTHVGWHYLLLTLLSVERVNDTLLAEAADLEPLIERFRGGKAEHNEQLVRWTGHYSGQGVCP